MKNLRIEENACAHFYADLQFVHDNAVTDRCAFVSKERRALILRVPRSICLINAFLEISVHDERKSIPLFFDSLDAETELYCCDLACLNVGLYFGYIRITTIFGTFCSMRQGTRLYFSKNEAFGDTLQISVSDFLNPVPDRYFGGAIYHIFVDRYAKGSHPVPQKAGARIVENWENGVPEFPAYPGAYLENNTYYGGTLYGVAERLDDIAALGVTLIYLSPIFEAYSNHKYDTGDYMHVDSMFGGDDALQYLVNEAKKRGIGILLDGVFNHTGSDSIYFNKKGTYPSVGAYQSKESPYYSWYSFQRYPEVYECWWGIPILPRIHPDGEECRAYFLGQGGVIEKYARMGIAGFRLDVADELSDDFIAGIKHTLCAHDPKSLLYGEVWEDASNKIAYGIRKSYYLGAELDGVMNYPLRKALLTYVIDHESDELRYVFCEVYPNTPKRILDAQMNLLGTHDTERILTVLGEEDVSGLSNADLAIKRMMPERRALAKKRLKMLYTVVATLPGLPMIYYGDEVGLEGYADPFNRMPYPYGNEDLDLLLHYRRIAEIRTKNKVYKCGEFALIAITDTFLVFSRTEGAYAYLTVLNQDLCPLRMMFTERGIDLLSGTKGQKLDIQPLSATIIKIRKNFEFEIQ